jgi:hypothetical protein
MGVVISGPELKAAQLALAEKASALVVVCTEYQACLEQLVSAAFDTSSIAPGISDAVAQAKVLTNMIAPIESQFNNVLADLACQADELDPFE